jgi:hypothetical protein
MFFESNQKFHNQQKLRFAELSILLLIKVLWIEGDFFCAWLMGRFRLLAYALLC